MSHTSSLNVMRFAIRKNRNIAVFFFILCIAVQGGDSAAQSSVSNTANPYGAQISPSDAIVQPYVSPPVRNRVISTSDEELDFLWNSPANTDNSRKTERFGNMVPPRGNASSNSYTGNISRESRFAPAREDSDISLQQNPGLTPGSPSSYREPPTPRISTSENTAFREERATLPPTFGSPYIPENREYPLSSERIAPSVAIPGRYSSFPATSREVPLGDTTHSYAKYLPYIQSSGVVVCASDQPLSDMEMIIREIAQLQHDLKAYLAIAEAREKIELCIFSSEKSYLTFLRKEFPDAPMDRRALYVKKKGPGIVLVQKTKDFEVDLRHEMTHAILHASIDRIPIWIDEGLAKYFEPPPDRRAFSNPYISRIRRNCNFGLVPSLERLEKLRDVGEMDVKEYRESWAWVHFMIHDSPQTHQLLADYLFLLSEHSRDTGSANAPPPRIAPSLRKTAKDPVAQFKKHFKTWKDDRD